MSLSTFENNEMPATRSDGQPNAIIGDDIRDNLLANLHDAITAAWNGWEAACKFQDEEQQDYYMNYVRACSDLMKKVRKF